MVEQAHRKARAALARSRCVVVKIGSKALDDHPAPPSTDMFEHLATSIQAIARPGERPSRRVVLVSSGAISQGLGQLGMARRPRSMEGLQAAAAAGQSLLMQRYAEAFDKVGLRVAQVLLTHADLSSRVRANNARAALLKLLGLKLLPIINENDAVAVDEICFGDNDELAAMVTPLCNADLLLLLSHVDGLLDEQGQRISYLPTVNEQASALASESTSAAGRGGMRSKLEAARRATLAGANVVIAPAAEPHVLERIIAGEDIGTLVPARGKRLSTRKHWIAYTLRPRGTAIVDSGAARAIQRDGRSVLCVGVVGVRGDFVQGDPIAVVSEQGTEIARGLTRLSATDAARLAGVRADSSALLIHRDDLVLVPRDVG